MEFCFSPLRWLVAVIVRNDSWIESLVVIIFGTLLLALAEQFLGLSLLEKDLFVFWVVLVK